MLKSHFKSSQFIVVSLKDGMFNNANVLFRTKFVYEISTVGRTTQVDYRSRTLKSRSELRAALAILNLP
jgi:chromosome segregation ATPase